MSKKIKWLLCISTGVIFTLGLLGFTTLIVSGQGYKISPFVFDNGGGKASSANYSTRASIGQAVIGPATSASYKQEAGYIYASHVIPKPPTVTEINPNSGLNTGPVSVTIFGSNFESGAEVKLTKAGLSDIPATNVRVSAPNKITCTFDLTGAPAGVRDVVVTNPDGQSARLRSCFYVLNPTFPPIFWERQEVGKSPAARDGDMLNVAVGDGDNDCDVEIYTSSKDGSVCQFSWDGTKWVRTIVGTSTARTDKDMLSVTVGDGDNDSKLEVYVGCKDTNVYQYSWDGTKWVRKIIGSSTVKPGGDMFSVVTGDGDNDGKLEVYGGCKGGNVYQFRWDEMKKVWVRKIIGTGTVKTILSVTIGDGDGDGKLEVYAGCKGGNLYQFSWDGTKWVRKIIGSSIARTGGDILSIAVGDGNNDKRLEVYASSMDTRVYQFSWDGMKWVRTIVGTSTADMLSVAVGDGDNDGEREVYSSSKKGNIYQFRWDEIRWVRTIIGSSTAKTRGDMLAVAIGDGNNGGSMKVYGASKEGKIYQFEARPTLLVELTTNKYEYEIGEPVEITIKVRNNTSSNITLTFPTSQLADFKIRNRAGDTVYTWSKHHYFLMVITKKVVPANGSLELLKFSWNQRDNNGNQVPAGKYYIDGWMVKTWEYPELHAATKEIVIKRPAGWIIPIYANIGNITGSVTCGVLSDATDGYDPHYEIPLPPPPADTTYIQLYFSHPEWKMVFTNFINDIKRYIPTREYIMWDFEVKTNAINTDIGLYLDIRDVPREYTKVKLIDTDENKSWYLRITPATITINSGREGHKRFKLIVMRAPVRLEHVFKAGWNMMSTPLSPVNPAPEDVVGDDVRIYYLYEWVDSRYQEVDKKKGSIVSGKGFWLGLVGTATIDIEGAKPTGTFSIPLKKGWNMIGCPFDFTPKWSETMVEKDGVRKTLSDAVKSGWIIDVLYTYDCGKYVVASCIEPWRGYWFPALVDCTLLISPNPQTIGSSSVASSVALKSDIQIPHSDSWQVNLQVQAGNYKDTVNNHPAFGIDPEASAGLDSYDKPEPPAPPQGEYVTLYFVHPKEEIFNKFDWDIRQPIKTDESTIWNFNVETNISGEVILTWDKDKLPQGYNFILVDSKTLGKIDMRVQNTYSYFVIPDSPANINTSAQFQIIVTKIKMQTDAPAVNLNEAYCYPNPAKDTVTFAKLTSPAKIKIFTLSGELVKTLENTDNNDSVEWNLTNDKGSKVASGVYIYLITNDKGEKKTGKVAVIR